MQTHTHTHIHTHVLRFDAVGAMETACDVIAGCTFGDASGNGWSLWYQWMPLRMGHPRLSQEPTRFSPECGHTLYIVIQLGKPYKLKMLNVIPAIVPSSGCSELTMVRCIEKNRPYITKLY